MLRSYSLPEDGSFLKKATGTKIKAPQDRDKNLNSVTAFSTARKGGTGNWRHCFSETNKLEFKEVVGESLVKLGYESSLDW